MLTRNSSGLRCLTVWGPTEEAQVTGAKRKENQMIRSEKMMFQKLIVAPRKLDGVVEQPYTTATGPLLGDAQFG